MGGVRNARMIKAQVCCSMGCKWCMAYAYILVCYVIPRASPSELHKHPRMHTYAIHHDNPCYNIYLYPNHLHFKGTATGSISHVPHGKLVVLRGTPSKPVVTVVQQLVLKNGYHMVAVPSRSKKKEGVKL